MLVSVSHRTSQRFQIHRARVAGRASRATWIALALGFFAFGCAAPAGPPPEPAPSCEESWADCDGDPSNGCERHLTIDGAHCGECNQECAADEICFRGACELAARVGPM